jgi:hypothetical protein
MTWDVYRCYDENDVLLYVGSGNTNDRLEEHKMKWWGPSIYLTAFEIYDVESDARQAEIKAIRTEHPLHNKVHNPDWSTIGKRLWKEHFNLAELKASPVRRKHLLPRPWYKVAGKIKKF